MGRLGARSRPSITVEGIERAVELLSWKITSDEGDMSFADLTSGQDYYLEGEAWQDTAQGSLWRYARDFSGTEAAFTVRPHGNAEPNADEPHYVGVLIVGPKPDLGGDAGARWFPFAFAWRIVGEPLELLEPIELIEPEA